MQNVLKLVRQLGSMMGEEMARSMLNAQVVTPRVREVLPCITPNCTRKRLACKLCMSHYYKARRLKMNTKRKLTMKQLRKLAQDGRKTRWQKAA